MSDFFAVYTHNNHLKLAITIEIQGMMREVRKVVV